MARTTAECFYTSIAVVLRVLCIHTIAETFHRQQKVSVTDGDGAIDKAERADAPSPDESNRKSTLRVLCGVHKTSNFREDSLNLRKTAITFVKHATLSLQFGCNLNAFRTALRILFMHAAVIIRDRLPSAHIRRRNELRLRACLPCTDENMDLFTTLLGLLPGNWDSRIIETFPPDTETDRQRMATLAGSLTNKIVDCGPIGFPTRNWIQSERAPSWMLRMEVAHRLFSRAYAIMLKLLDNTWDPTNPLGDDNKDGGPGGAADAADAAPPPCEPDVEDGVEDVNADQPQESGKDGDKGGIENESEKERKNKPCTGAIPTNGSIVIQELFSSTCCYW